MQQLQLFPVLRKERRREVRCPVCHGVPRLCVPSGCPYLIKLKTWREVNRALASTNLFGASPPSVFVGEWGYPRVLTGPLVPPIAHADTSIMDLPEQWVSRTFDDILRYRLSLVRGKTPIHVNAARSPTGLLPVIQEMVMASQPTDTEVWLSKRPNLEVIFSPRSAPVGPSAPIVKAKLTENPQVPKPVERVVTDTDLKAVDGAVALYDNGVSQSQITRLLAIGLLGVKRQRRLVPTEWSITATDDILGKALWREVLDYKELNEFQVFGHYALGNNIQILLMPTPWMFEALECWLTVPEPMVFGDHELARGRKTYPTSLAGAYHAARLPVLEYLKQIRRQAGAIVFLEVTSEWIPLGVWRVREIAREAFKGKLVRFDLLTESLEELGTRLRHPIHRWMDASRIIRYYQTQRRIEKYVKGVA